MSGYSTSKTPTNMPPSSQERNKSITVNPTSEHFQIMSLRRKNKDYWKNNESLLTDKARLLLTTASPINMQLLPPKRLFFPVFMENTCSLFCWFMKWQEDVLTLCNVCINQKTGRKKKYATAGEDSVVVWHVSRLEKEGKEELAAVSLFKYKL